MSKADGPAVTPHLIIFDQARTLQYVGRIDDSEREQFVKVHDARNALDALLAGKQPAVKQTKVIGCSTKWAGKAEAAKAFLDKLAAEPVSVSPIQEAGLRELHKNGSGKFRLINFWATWCAPCLAEFHEFVTMNRMYRHRDIEIITVSMNAPDEQKSVLGFLKKQQASMKNYIFAEGERDKFVDAFEPKWQGAAPYTVLLDPDGKVIYEETGSIDALALRRAIVKALNEKKPW